MESSVFDKHLLLENKPVVFVEFPRKYIILGQFDLFDRILDSIKEHRSFYESSKMIHNILSPSPVLLQ